MDYLIITACEFVGIFFNVMENIIKQRNQNPKMGFKEVFKTFFSEDWDTLMLSGGIVVANLLIHLIIANYAVQLTTGEYYHLVAFGTALLLGYLGQRKLYGWLGTAESALDKKVNKILS